MPPLPPLLSSSSSFKSLTMLFALHCTCHWAAWHWHRQYSHDNFGSGILCILFPDSDFLPRNVAIFASSGNDTTSILPSQIIATRESSLSSSCPMQRWRQCQCCADSGACPAPIPPRHIHNRPLSHCIAFVIGVIPILPPPPLPIMSTIPCTTQTRCCVWSHLPGPLAVNCKLQSHSPTGKCTLSRGKAKVTHP